MKIGEKQVLKLKYFAFTKEVAKLAQEAGYHSSEEGLLSIGRDKHGFYISKWLSPDFPKKGWRIIPKDAEGIFLGLGIEPYLFIKRIGKKCYLPLVAEEDEQNERGSKKAVA